MPHHKVVVTGGAGFVGSHLVDRLLQDPACEVVVLDDLSRGRAANLVRHRGDPRFAFVQADVVEPEVVAAVVRGARTVYHLAAQATVLGATRDPGRAFRSNVVGTFTLLRACAAASVDRLVFTSSREVYGEPIDVPVAESHPLLAINLYGATKVAGEALCRSFRREFGLDTAILRLANVYGPRDVDRVIPLWLDLARGGVDLEVFGGKQVLDFIWVGHVVDALIKVAKLRGAVPPINIGSGTGTPILELARRVAHVTGSSSRVMLSAARDVEVKRFVASPERMRELLAIE
ncbi:MAG TPA: SDR family NAD(P)-dependent oxidoreductase, partial [Candidatus Limnocylindria bacterium]|nr:SDR family NAD(P)-dependent oxidoreductase [Candidatus Limnocylindria bacterium]